METNLEDYNSSLKLTITPNGYAGIGLTTNKYINMETKYNFVISACDVILDEGTMKDVITTIHWRYNAENDGFFAETYGASAMGQPTPENFTDYAEVTKEQMESWLEATLDVEAMQESLNAQIELLKNPITATLPPPFDNAGVEEPLQTDVLDGQVIVE